MPSSISSSSHRAPKGPWRRTLTAALILAAAILLALEFIWRSAGHLPGVTDDRALWASWRHAARGADRRTVVAVGSSRMQLGFAPEAWREVFPDQRTIQLAVDGTQGAATLHDLASDESFAGIVLFDTAASIVPVTLKSQQDYIDYYHHGWSLYQRGERALATWVQSNLVIAHPSLRLDRVARDLLAGVRPAIYPVQTMADRSRRARYTPDSPKAKDAGSPSQEIPWQQRAAGLKEDAQRITRRGGKVIFVRIPISPEWRRIEENRYPRSRYWDPFAAWIESPAINFEDVPELSALQCPEGVHLDYTEARRFTAVLARVIGR